MTRTGWTGEPPAEAPPMPLTSLLMANRERGPGDALEAARARGQATEARQARDEAARAIDPDDYAAALIGRGYLPGAASELSMKLADIESDLESEREKIERGARRHEIAMREHAAGRMDAMAVQRMLDGDFGDAHRAEQLERRAERLHRQLQETAQLMVPPEARARNAVEEASSRARRILAEVTSQRQADDEAYARVRTQLQQDRSAFYASRGRRPFGAGDGPAEPDHQDAVRGNFVVAPVPGAVPYCRDCGKVAGVCACTGTAYR